jgi:hypothetical protein
MAKSVRPGFILITDGRVPAVYHVELGTDLIADSSGNASFVKDFQTLSGVKCPI